MKPLVIFIAVLVFNLGLTACDFDKQRELDLQYPVTLDLINSTSYKLTINSIYNSADTQAGFLLKGKAVSAGERYNLKISEPTFNAISEGEYFIEGSCGEVKNWQASGKVLESVVVRNDVEWKIVITVENCM